VTVLQFILLGLGLGALYGLAASGIVLIYRGSGVINLAHGAVGMVGTYAFWVIHDQHSQPFVVAFVPAIVLCALLGMVIQRFVMYPLRASSPVSRLLATLGVLATLQGAVSLKYPDEVEVVRSSLPTTALHIGSLRVGEDRMVILGISLALALTLGLVYRYTQFGLATSAVAENPRVAGHLGCSSNAIASANWALGSMLAGLAGILLAPITGLETTSLTLLVVPALAAALVGSMVSFPLAIGGGLFIGVSQSLLSRYVSTSGWSTAVPFFLVLIVLLSRGTALPARGESSLRLPRIGSGNIRWIPVLVSVAAGLAFLEAAPLSWVDGATVTILSAIILLSVVVVTGYAGQVSLAQVALAGTATLVASRLLSNAHFPFLLAILGGTLAAIPIGLVVSLPALRARGSNLAIVTLAMSVAVEALILDQASISGGDTGISIGFPTLFGFGIDDIGHPRRYAILGLVAFTLCALGIANLRRGKSGRRLIAVRANERAAASLGVSVVGAKLYAFALSGFLAGLGGILLSFRAPSVVLSNFQSFDSVTYVADAVIGGVGHVVGPPVGGVLQVGGLGTNVGQLFGASAQKYLPVVAGLLLILVLITDPDGVAASASGHIRRLLSRFTGSAGATDARSLRQLSVSSSEIPDGRTNAREPTRLSVVNASVRFGSTYALQDATIEINPGEVVGLIGPNGAGKTTLIDVLTGLVSPTQGTVEFGDTDITRWSPRKRGAAGIARSFQSLELFEDMTVLENLLVASEQRSVAAHLTDLVAPGTPRMNSAAVAAADQFDLWDDLDRRPPELSHGRRRILAIARAIAAAPAVLLLDESAAGLNPVEREELSSLIRSIAETRNTGVLLIEHDVEMVMRTSDRVVALEFGRVIAEGTPEEVRRNTDVIRSYLGVDNEDAGEPALGMVGEV
jgi:ABC-type branched-subunit amino acid transport system ATPase component/branched-subunit amino acid ABC-type transport system permease component